MHRAHSGWFRHLAIGSLVAVASLLGLAGCYRGGWGDPDRVERRTDNIIEDVKDDLELRPDQEPAYDALTAKIKTHVMERNKTHRTLSRNLRTEFEAQPVNSERVADLLKAHLAATADHSPQQVLVDDVAAFYRTLDAEQQRTLDKKVLRILKWHD